MLRGQNSSVLCVTVCYPHIYDRLIAKQIPNLVYLGKTEERIFGCTRHERRREWGNCLMRSSVMPLRWSHQE